MTNVPTIQILLVDDDFIFGLGLRTILLENNFIDLQIINQVTSAESALESLTTVLPDLVVLELDLKLKSPSQLSGLQLCQTLQTQYPSLPVFLLTSQRNSQELVTAYNLGVKGYCLKGTSIENLVKGLRKVANNQNSWQIPASLATIIPQKKQYNWFNLQAKEGLKQIDQNLKQVNNSLKNSQLPLLDWLYWTGRKRELRLARWLVNQLSPVEYVVVQNLPSSDTIANLPPNTSANPITSQLALIPQGNQTINESNLFTATLTQIQAGVNNLTKKPLEIDILRDKQKKELLYLISTQVSRTVEEIKFTDTDQEDLSVNIEAIIKDIWQFCSFEFISKYYGYVFENKVSLLDILIKEVEFVNIDVLTKIPCSLETLEYLIAEDTVSEPEKVKERFAILWHNMLIQIANGVMLTILNNFVDREIKQPEIYNQKISSSRDVAEFRNRLSWKYRIDKYFQEPKDIFEDKYEVYYFSDGGIKRTFIKANRKLELKQLRGLRWLVTIAIEARDAIAPGVKSLIDSLAKTVIYLLTEVIGKGIGLIGKGFIQGIGNTLQETRYRNRDQRK